MAQRYRACCQRHPQAVVERPTRRNVERRCPRARIRCHLLRKRKADLPGGEHQHGVGGHRRAYSTAGERKGVRDVPQRGGIANLHVELDPVVGHRVVTVHAAAIPEDVLTRRRDVHVRDRHRLPAYGDVRSRSPCRHAALPNLPNRRNRRIARCIPGVRLVEKRVADILEVRVEVVGDGCTRDGQSADVLHTEPHPDDLPQRIGVLRTTDLLPDARIRCRCVHHEGPARGERLRQPLHRCVGAVCNGGVRRCALGDGEAHRHVRAGVRLKRGVERCRDDVATGGDCEVGPPAGGAQRQRRRQGIADDNGICRQRRVAGVAELNRIRPRAVGLPVGGTPLEERCLGRVWRWWNLLPADGAGELELPAGLLWRSELPGERCGVGDLRVRRELRRRVVDLQRHTGGVVGLRCTQVADVPGDRSAADRDPGGGRRRDELRPCRQHIGDDAVDEVELPISAARCGVVLVDADLVGDRIPDHLPGAVAADPGAIEHLLPNLPGIARLGGGGNKWCAELHHPRSARSLNRCRHAHAIPDAGSIAGHPIGEGDHDGHRAGAATRGNATTAVHEADLTASPWRRSGDRRSPTRRGDAHAVHYERAGYIVQDGCRLRSGRKAEVDGVREGLPAADRGVADDLLQVEAVALWVRRLDYVLCPCASACNDKPCK